MLTKVFDLLKMIQNFPPTKTQQLCEVYTWKNQKESRRFRQVRGQHGHNKRSCKQKISDESIDQHTPSKMMALLQTSIHY